MSVLELNLESLGKIYGRDTELQSLKDAWQGCLERRSHETVLVYGHAGSGKTALVRHSLECSSAIIGAGKFDQLRSRQPFAALSTALTDVVDQLLRKEATCRALHERLEGHKLVNLFPLIPSLSKLVTAPECSQDSSVKAIENSLIYLMREIPDPVILFMDDLQFADEASLELLIAMASDHTCQGVGYVFCYRDAEIDSTHPWDKRLRQVECSTRLHVKDLSVGTINKLLCDLTERRDCEELAALVHYKTGGNIFYTLQLLEVLQNKSLLYYDMRTYRWMWKTEDIRDECNLSDNVVDLVVERLGCLDEETVEVLQVASCLGARFDVNVLTEVLSRPVESSLEKAAKERLISETHQSAVYRWAHDRIQEAVYGSMEDASTLHFRIGNTLKPQLSLDAVDDTTMLAIVDQLNHGRCHMSEYDKSWLVERNIKAARVAFERSAFFPALDFVNAGISILGEEGWSHQYDAMLELSTMAVKGHFAVGDMDACLDQVSCHLRYARNIDDEIGIYPIELKATFNKSVKDSVDRGVEILRRITGKRFPRHPSGVKVFWYAIRMKRRLSKLPISALTDMPECDNERIAVAIEIMASLSLSCWLALESHLLAFLSLRCIEFSLEHGLASAFPFAFFFFILGRFKDYEMAYELAEVTLELTNRFSASDQARTNILLRLYGLTLRRPVHDQIEPLISAYKLSMEVGEVVWSGIAVTGFVHSTFFSGRPLASLKDDALSFYREMLKYGQGDTYGEFLAPCLQVILNLTSAGGEGNPAILEGSFVQPEVYWRQANVKNSTFQCFTLMRLVLAVHFMDLDVCEEASELYWHGPKKFDNCNFSSVCRRFYHGLTAFALARRKRKNYRRGQQIVLELRELVEFGNVNCTHLLLILRAEEVVHGGCRDHVKQAYDKAISASARSGFIGDAALASQRAGLYFIEAGDTTEGLRYMQSSVDFYDKWNASAVVKHLQKKYGVISGEERRRARSRRRASFCSSITEKHRVQPTLLLEGSSYSMAISH